MHLLIAGKKICKAATVVRWRHWTAALLMIAVALIQPLSLTPMLAYAEPAAKDVSYTIAGRVNNCGTMQGGATDGQFLYFACSYDDKSKIRIVKSTIDGKIVDTSDGFSRRRLGHANDMTYNSKLKMLVVSTWDYGGNGVVFIDPQTFSIKDTKKTDDGQSTSNLCYDSSTDQYVVGGKVYDSEFKYKNKKLFTPSGVDDDADTTEGKVLNQGIECDSKYIYVMRVVWGNNGYNMVAVYDWNGTNVAVYKINLNDEGENMSVVGGSFYMGINEGSMSSGGSSPNDYFIKLEGINVGGSARPMVVGSYNVLGAMANGGEGACNNAFENRMKTVAKNIVELNMDVVGIQEYTSSEACGSSKPLMDALGSDWKITKENVSGGTLKENEAAIVWNSKQMTLIDVDVKVIPGWKAATTGCHSLSGGSWNVPVAHFQSIGGQEFYIASSHWINGGDSTTKDFCLTQRIKDTETMLGWLKEFRQNPVFLVGDTNSKIDSDPTIHPTVKQNGFLDASATATEKENANISTIAEAGVGNAKDSDSHIDRIFYNQSAGAPSKYITLACRSKSECGSDHRPVTATFPSVMVGGSQGGCDGNYNKEQFSAWQILYYDPSCACSESSIIGLVGESNFARIANYFASRGLKDTAVAGILANLQNESRLTPFAVQGQPKNTSGPGEPPSGGGYGIAQFTPATKISQVLEKDARTTQYFGKYYSTQFGGYAIKPWNEGGTGIPEGVPEIVNDAWLNTQLDFFYKGEMQSTKVGSYRNLGGTMGLDYIRDSDTILEALANAKDEKDAARIFVWIYERPADKPGAAKGREAVATQMLPHVQQIIGSSGSSTATVSSGSIGCPDTTTSTDGDFAKTVKAFAWEDGRRGADQKEAYTKALVGRYKGGNNGNDCGAFVSALMVKSGFEPNYPGTNTSGQAAWLKQHWEKIYDIGAADTSQLRAGDVAVIPGSHVFVWIGDMSDQGFVGQSAEAALGSNTAPTAIKDDNTFSDPTKYTWYRKKG